MVLKEKKMIIHPILLDRIKIDTKLRASLSNHVVFKHQIQQEFSFKVSTFNWNHKRTSLSVWYLNSNCKGYASLKRSIAVITLLLSEKTVIF